MIDTLNARFAIPDRLAFSEGAGGMVRASVANAYAHAEIYLHGAHVTSFVPRGETPVLWLSESAEYRPGRAIRGGVPLCWPWFAAHPVDDSLPSHGFARTASWHVSDTRSTEDGATRIRFCLEDSDASRALWPHRFMLEYAITVGQRLSLELKTTNRGDTPVDVGGAIHTYFAVGEIEQARIEGLENTRYLDKLDGGALRRQDGPVRPTSAMDRIYTDTAADCVVVDGANHRAIRIEKKGSRTTVVWNPWRDGARATRDFDDDGYRRMVCVEAVNVGDDVRTLSPGSSHTLAQTIGIER